MIDMKRVRAAWTRAGTFSTDKESAYPEHAVAQEFDSHTEKRVLEYGCGAGSDALSYARRGNFVVACDVVAENCETTRQNVDVLGMPGVIATQWLMQSAPLPFADNQFDLVNSHGVLHHIPDPYPILQEFHRVLRPDGLLYVMLYTEHLWNECKERVAELMATQGLSEWEAFGWCTDGQGVPYATYYSHFGAQSLLQSCGFWVLSAFEYNKRHFRTYRCRRAPR